MEPLFDIKCRSCGSPVSFDITAQTYRCPSCGLMTGIQEAHSQARFRPLEGGDRVKKVTFPEIASCPGCGAEVLFEGDQGGAFCSFCGSAMTRQSFEKNDDFPELMIPFQLTKEEAASALLSWSESTGETWVREKIDDLEGWYLPYSLIRGPVSGYVRRERVRREFPFRGYAERALVSTSRQLKNPVLDGAEPYDLSALQPFEHGLIAGHKVKIADLSGAKKQRRLLLEAGEALKPGFQRQFHTEGIRVNLQEGQLMEIPLLLPMYILKSGRRMAVVNGQTGRVAGQREPEIRRSKLWMIEPGILSLLILLTLWLPLGSPVLALISAIPLFILIWHQYASGRFTLLTSGVLRGEAVQARRKGETLETKKEPLPENAYSLKPVFTLTVNGQVRDVDLRFYPFTRVLEVGFKALLSYFLPLILGAILHFGFGIGEHFRPMGAIPWFWCFGIFSLVYVFSGIRGDAYERPYVYPLVMSPGSQKPRISRSPIGSFSSRRLPFFQALGLDKNSPVPLKPLVPRLVGLGFGLLGVLIASTLCMIL